MGILKSRSGWDKALFLAVGMGSAILGGILANRRDDPAGPAVASLSAASSDPGRDWAYRTRGKAPRYQRSQTPTVEGEPSTPPIAQPGAE